MYDYGTHTFRPLQRPGASVIARVLTSAVLQGCQ